MKLAFRRIAVPLVIGQQTTIKVRKDLRRYIRKDRCLPPGSGKPVACPDS